MSDHTELESQMEAMCREVAHQQLCDGFSQQIRLTMAREWLIAEKWQPEITLADFTEPPDFLVVHLERRRAEDILLEPERMRLAYPFQPPGDSRYLLAVLALAILQAEVQVRVKVHQGWEVCGLAAREIAVADRGDTTGYRKVGTWQKAEHWRCRIYKPLPVDPEKEAWDRERLDEISKGKGG